MSKISIIVPVYNAEKYLRKCIESILNQTFKDFELILVDDGSTDSSGKICDEYALKDSRIKVIHKENGGLSSARNAGLDVAKGEYIGFVDSDDWIEMDMYGELYRLIKENNTDISVCGINNIKDIKYKNENLKEKIQIIKKEGEEFKKNRYGEYYLGVSVWNKLYRKEVIEDIRFLKDRIYEDLPFGIEVFAKIKSYVYTSKKLYNYFQLNESTTRSKISLKHLSILKNTLYCYEKVSEEYKQMFLNNIVGNCIYICVVVVNEKSILENKNLLKGMKEILVSNKNLIKKIEYKNFKEKLQFEVIKMSPVLFCKLYTFGKKIKKIFRS